MKKERPNKIKLIRTIVLETGEVIPANSLLEPEEHFPLWTLVPYKKGYPSSEIEDCDILNFCRIPRQCIKVDGLTDMLRDMLIEGDNTVAPFSCSLRQFEHGVAVLEDPHNLPPHVTASYDNLFNPINIIEFCTFKDLLNGKFRNIPHFSDIVTAENYNTYCTIYHYNECTELKVVNTRDSHFYKELQSYEYQISFDEINIGDEIECYITENNRALHMQHLLILDKGYGSEWWERFRCSHSGICGEENDYKPFEGEAHILARCEYFDKNVITGKKKIVILHQSSYNGYLMTKTSNLKALIDP